MKNTQENFIAGKTQSFTFVVGTTSLAFVVSQLDVSIVNIALPEISRSFSIGVSALQWIVDAYTIAFAVLMLSAGSMGDLLGSKRAFQYGLLLFGAASVGCGLAWNPFSLTGFRALQGIGAALMIPSSLSILNQAFVHDKTKRARAVAAWTAAGGVSIAAGPILGGFLIHLRDWRLIFLVNIPICLTGILLSFRLPESARHHSKGFDIPGQLIWMFALTAFIAAVIEWHNLGIDHPFIYGSLLFSICMMWWFIRVEKKAVSPVLPLELFRAPAFSVLILLGVALNNAYYGTVFVLSLYLQNVLQYSSLTAGMAFLPLTAGFIISNIISGRLTGRFGIRTPILLGLLIAAAGFSGLLLAKTHTPYWQLFIPFITIPMGMGLAVPAMTTGILASVPKTRSGTASAILNTTRQAAGAMGVAVFGAMANGGTGAIVHAIVLSAIISAITLLCSAGLIYRYLHA
jgi:DHA2 family methylenomycin A resistance protein-like MFS transporter